MTPLQKKALDFIAGSIERLGYAPSYAEIQEHLGCSSKSGVARVIEGLVDAGRLIKRPYRTRGLELARHDLSGIPTADLVAELERRGWRQVSEQTAGKEVAPCATCDGQGKVLGRSGWYNCGSSGFDLIEDCPTCGASNG